MDGSTSPAALVTGSARRVGRAIAASLIDRGWRVVIHATDAARAQLAAAELGAVGGAGGDLREPAAIERLAYSALELTGGELDLLVNNAASFVQETPLGVTLDGWRDAMDVNARAPLLLTQALAPALRAGSGGMILNISDRAAHEHWLQHSAHSASKAALNSLTMTLARELHPQVRVNAVAPGTILPPDDASVDFLERKERAGDLGTPSDVTDILFELLANPARTGEIRVL